MADLFISYAREDQAFVHRLHDALEAAGRDAWFDTFDIPKTAPWLDEVRSGIEQAHAFLFVISPDSIASAVCHQELEHAVALHKRLIPLVRRDVPAEAVPPVLADLNWIFGRDADDFDAAVEAVGVALDTDLDWARAHSRLLVRAIEWERQRFERSWLLRGRDLRAAEDALAAVGAQLTPQPTPLQRRYVLASRRAATRDQGWRLGFVSLALVVALGLAALAAFQWQAAERERAITLARQLAAQADLLATQQADFLPTATLLAVEALRRFPSLEADQAVRHSADLLPAPTAHLTHRAEGLPPNPLLLRLTDVAFSPDGARVATAALDRTARLWDAATGAAVARLQHDGSVNTLAFDPGNRWLATGSGTDSLNGLEPLPDGDNALRLWDLAGGQVIARAAHRLPVRQIVVAPNGRYLVTLAQTRLWAVTAGYEAQLWQTEPLQPIKSLGSGVWAVAFTPDSARLVGSTNVNFATAVRVWDTGTGAEVGRFDVTVAPNSLAISPSGLSLATGGVGGPKLTTLSGRGEGVDFGYDRTVRAVAFSPDGRYLAAAGDDATARLWDTATGREVARLPHGGPVERVAFSGNGAYLATVAGRSASLWAVPSGREVARATHGGPIVAADFDPQGRWLATAGEDGDAWVWSIADSGRERRRLQQRLGAEVLAFSPDGRTLATTSREPSAAIWAVETGRQSAGIAATTDAEARSVAYRPDGAQVAIGDSEGVVRLVEAATGREAGRLQAGERVTAVAYSPDGTRLATASQSLTYRYTVRLWSLPDGRQLAAIPNQASVERFAFSPDGASLVSVENPPYSAPTVTHLWDAGTGAERRRLAYGGLVLQTAFSADGRRLATAAWDGTARLWDPTTGQELQQLRAGAKVSQVRFSPDGATLATLADERDVRLWATADGREIARLAHEQPVRDLSFAPDGAELATAGEDGTVRLWSVPAGREVGRLRLAGAGRGLAFSPDGRWLAAADADGLVQLWLWRPADLIEAACARLTRDLTAGEWRQYVGAEPQRPTCASLAPAAR